MDVVHNNLGNMHYVSKFNDPKVLKNLCFN